MIIIILIPAVSGPFIVGSMLKYEATPEQDAKVEVAKKRIRYENAGKAGGVFHYCIDFKFSDGSVKEIWIQNYANSNSSKAKRKVYNSIHEGETGILTYKSFAYNYLISFEKDLEYGGQKIEQQKIYTTDKLYIVVSVFMMVVIMGGLFKLIASFTIENELKLNAMPEINERAKAVSKIKSKKKQ